MPFACLLCNQTQSLQSPCEQPLSCNVCNRKKALKQLCWPKDCHPTPVKIMFCKKEEKKKHPYLQEIKFGSTKLLILCVQVRDCSLEEEWDCEEYDNEDGSGVRTYCSTQTKSSYRLNISEILPVSPRLL